MYSGLDIQLKTNQIDSQQTGKFKTQIFNMFSYMNNGEVVDKKL